MSATEYDDDHGGERGVRHQRDDRREQQQRRERGRRRDEPGELRARAGLRFTAVCVVPPPAGIAPSRPPPMFATPIASSSRFAPRRGSSGAANARPAAMSR